MEQSPPNSQPDLRKDSKANSSSPRRRGWRRFTLISVVAVLAVLALLILWSVLGAWGSILHSQCETRQAEGTFNVQIPALLLNSPYGGLAWGNVSFVPGFLPNDVTGEGTRDSNGGADWAGFDSKVILSSVENVTAWGAGENTRCTSPYALTLEPTGNLSQGIPIMGPGNSSDALEPTTISGGTLPSVSFDNQFVVSNGDNVSTCGGSAKSLPLVVSSYLILSFRFNSTGQSHEAPLDLPITSSQYHYWFPANFGTWQVDNLSEPGGPGGGWSFNFVGPCK